MDTQHTTAKITRHRDGSRSLTITTLSGNWIACDILAGLNSEAERHAGNDHHCIAKGCRDAATAVYEAVMADAKWSWRAAAASTRRTA